MASPDSPGRSSTSPLAASSASLPQAPAGTLGRLVTHVVASKRSLSSTAHVYRANEIVSSARTLLESLATNTAQTEYLRRAIENQLNLLKSIHRGLCVAADEAHKDFQSVLKRLDAVDADIQTTLQVLREAEIEPTFRPASEGPRNLHSFLDEKGVGELKAQFRQWIDHTTKAQGDFSDLNTEFGEIITRIEASLAEPDDEESEPRRGLVNSKIHDSDETDGPAALFRGLEEHASEMAGLLQSLVKHYDLCITALKNTEGGGEAVYAAFQRSDRDAGEVKETFDQLNDAEPMSAQERAEMLQVLDDDAGQVDDVSNEMREHAAEMETQLARLELRADYGTRDRKRASKTLTHLEELSTSGNLAKYVSASKTYARRWGEICTRIETGLEEFAQLAVFFKGFQTAYQYLLLEIDRRRRTRIAMDQVISETQRTITELYEEEDEKRKQFRVKYGDFLPADMWPPLIDPPTKWTIERHDDGTVDIPAVREESLGLAKQQLQGRRRSRG
ncbi:MAG: hypothetical protein Q9159_003570 [Coniocarpon cinnabarinum]